MKIPRNYAIRLIKQGKAVIEKSLGSSMYETAHTIKIWRKDLTRHDYYMAAPCETVAFVVPHRRSVAANWGA